MMASFLAHFVAAAAVKSTPASVAELDEGISEADGIQNVECLCYFADGGGIIVISLQKLISYHELPRST